MFSRIERKGCMLLDQMTTYKVVCGRREVGYRKQRWNYICLGQMYLETILVHRN
jgi:hypothetical protein